MHHSHQAKRLQSSGKLQNKENMRTHPEGNSRREDRSIQGTSEYNCFVYFGNNCLFGTGETKLTKTIIDWFHRKEPQQKRIAFLLNRQWKERIPITKGKNVHQTWVVACLTKISHQRNSQCWSHASIPAHVRFSTASWWPRYYIHAVLPHTNEVMLYMCVRKSMQPQ